MDNAPMKSRDANEQNSLQLSPQKYSLNLTEQIKELNQEFEKFGKLMENPMVLGSIFYGLKVSTENSNSLLQDLIRALRSIDQRLASLEENFKTAQATPRTTPELLGPKDREVFDFVQKHKQVCADDLQNNFGYKGKNAASARLNRLHTMGLLDKVQSGRVVYYITKS